MLQSKGKIAVVGLGKLGACLAGILAEKGYEVQGSDIDKRVVDKINQKIAPNDENGLNDLIKKVGKRLLADTNTEKVCLHAEIIFVVVPTPSKIDGSFSLDFMEKALVNIAKALKRNICPFPLIVITSTVLPEDCKKYLIPTIEKFSNKKCGVDFGFCYNPEFIALGSVIKDMKNPDMVLIGEFNKDSGDKLSKVYGKIIENNASIERMNIVNAEIVKLSINTFVTTKISYANMLTEICHNTVNANIDVVSSALGKDTRIGIKYLKGGTSYGGPCFPRDNRAFVKMAKDKKVDAAIATATDAINREHIHFIYKAIQRAVNPKGTVALLGFSYKPETWVTEESAGIHLANRLIKKGFKVFGYDANCVGKLKLSTIDLKLETTIEKCIHKSDVVVILNNDATYKKIVPTDLKSGAMVIDCWRILDKKAWKNSKQLIALGVGQID